MGFSRLKKKQLNYQIKIELNQSKFHFDNFLLPNLNVLKPKRYRNFYQKFKSQNCLEKANIFSGHRGTVLYIISKK